MTAIAKKFYNLFWSDPTCQQIFSVNKSQLLEDEVELIVSKEKFYARRLVLTNSQKRKAGTKIIKRAENENIELIHKLEDAVKKYLDETRLETYVMNKFGKTIKKINEDLNTSGGWFKLAFKLIETLNDEKSLFKLLSDYHLIPESIENKQQFVEYYEKEFTSHLKEFIKKENLSDLAISIDLISTFYNYKTKNNLLSATKHYTDILYNEENYKNRLDFFDSLYEISVIKGGILKGYYECVNCPPNTFSGIVTTDIKPSKLKLKCPQCLSELLYIIPYELDETIYKHIVNKDGLLIYAVQYLLEKSNYSFQLNQTFLTDIEVDICLINGQNQIYEIIEVKMFKTNRPDDTQIGNIKTAVSQMKTTIDKLCQIDLGFKTIKHSIVTNISSDSIYNKVQKELEQDLIEYQISIYSIQDFY